MNGNKDGKSKESSVGREYTDLGSSIKLIETLYKEKKKGESLAKREGALAHMGVEASV